MGLDYALLAAVFTALVDALPVLGTGTVLFPWALGCFLMGNMEQGTEPVSASNMSTDTSRILRCP